MTGKNNREKRRSNTGWLHLQGLALYLSFRLAAVVEAIIGLLTAPFRWSWARLESGWFRLKPWLKRHKRRLIWSFLALVILTALAGGAVTVYLWRDELTAVAFRLQGALSTLITRLHRRAEPVVVVATRTVEEAQVTAMPGLDGAGQ